MKMKIRVVDIGSVHCGSSARSARNHQKAVPVLVKGAHLDTTARLAAGRCQNSQPQKLSGLRYVAQASSAASSRGVPAPCCFGLPAADAANPAGVVHLFDSQHRRAGKCAGRFHRQPSSIPNYRLVRHLLAVAAVMFLTMPVLSATFRWGATSDTIYVENGGFRALCANQNRAPAPTPPP